MDAFPPVFQPSQLIYPSLAQCFVNSLAIAIQTLGLHPIDESSPIHIEATPYIGRYRSAIALTLAPTAKAQLATTLGAIAQSHLDRTLNPTRASQACRVTPQTTGWIEMQCSLGLQLKVINYLTANPSTISPQPLTLFPSNQLSPELIFELEYAHARCSSQLRRAQSIAPTQDRLLPQAITPWLTDYFKLHPIQDSIEQQLWLHLLNFPSELQPKKQLIANLNPPATTLQTHQALLTYTLMASPLPRKQLRALSQAWVTLFQKFYSQSRLFEITEPDNKNLLALRISLFSGLRTVLHFMLTELLHHAAPQIL